MRAAVTAVQPAVAITWTHEHSVVVVEPQPRPEQFDEIGQYARVVDEFFDRVPPGNERHFAPLFRSAVRVGLEFPVGEVVEFGYFIGRQDTLDDDIAFEVKYELFFDIHKVPAVKI